MQDHWKDLDALPGEAPTEDKLPLNPALRLILLDAGDVLPRLFLGLAVIHGAGFLAFAAYAGLSWRNTAALVAALLHLIAYALARRGKAAWALRFSLWVEWALLLLWPLAVAGVRTPALLALPLLVMCSGWILPRREVLLLVAASLGALLLLTLAESLHWLPPPIVRSHWTHFLTLATAIVAASWVALFMNNGFVRHYRRLATLSRSLRHLAWHDTLTGLPNRAAMLEHLESALARARREARAVAVLFIDLDDFKNINDSLGHTAGDHVLTVVAVRLGQGLRAGDLVARFGGDEFIAVLHDLPDIYTVSHAAERILARLAEPIRLDSGREVHANASIGIALFPSDGESAETLIRNADSAMYRAKAQSQRSFSFYEEAMTEHARKRIRLEALLRQATKRAELCLVLQAQVDMADGRLVGAEALVRWSSPELGWTLPGDFIPLAEEIGVIGEVGAWVLDEACRIWRLLADRGLALPKLAVNVSARQLTPSLLPVVASALPRHGLPPGVLQIEVTETALMSSEEATAALAGLRALGLTVAVDDFGIGHSSLARLKSLPLDTLKIDRAFTSRIGRSVNDEVIARLILRLADTLGLSVVAEGVESAEQAEFLLENGCHVGQGHLYGHPATPGDFLARWGAA